MPLNTDKFIVPDGAPVGGIQKMKSVTWGEIVTELGNNNYVMPIADGNAGDALTTDGAGNVKFEPIPKAGSIDSAYSTVTSAPPAAGTFRLNNSTPSAATNVFLSEIDANGNDVGAYVQFAIRPGNILVLQNRMDPGDFIAFDVVTNADSGTYATLVVNFIEEGGAGLANGEIYNIAVLSGTGSVAETSSMQSGAISTQQIAPPPVRGMVWNNITQVNATKLFISHESLQGVSNQQLLDVAGQVDGVVTLVQVGIPDNFQVWAITAVTTHPAYVEYDISFIAANGGNFVNLTTIAVGINSPGTVTVDSTLTGMGTTSSPLSVVTKFNLDFDVNDAIFPSSSAGADSRNGHPIASYDDTVAESLLFGKGFPDNYNGENINIDIDWVAETATTGGVTWGVEIEANAAGGNDIDSDSFAAQQTFNNTTNGTSGIITTTTISLTQAQADAIAKNDAFRLRLQRVVGDVGDTMVGDAQVLKVSVRV